MLSAPPWTVDREHAEREQRRRRVVAFVTVFGIGLVAGLGYVFSRAPVYEASASLLVSAAPDVDQEAAVANPQLVAIQRQRLLGPAVLDAARERLAASGARAAPPLPELRAMLRVEPVPDSDVVTLRARGDDRQWLVDWVDAWTAAYVDSRTREARSESSSTTEAVRERHHELARKIERKRTELEAFRHDAQILTLERSENASLARLNGITRALNTAKEAEVNARARLDAVEQAIARGEPVVPDRDKRSIANLETRAQQLRERQTELNRVYTPEFIALDPSLRVIPEQLAALDATIAERLQSGRDFVLSEARQALASARETVRGLESQLAQHRQQAIEFTAKFAQHDALQQDLARIEELYRDSEQRLVKLELRDEQREPPVTVIEAAFAETRPVWPHYGRDSAIALGGALLAAVLALWLTDFVLRRDASGGAVNLTGIRIHADAPAAGLARAAVEPRLEHAGAAPALENAPPRELSEDEVSALWQAADPATAGVLALLLSGLRLDEIAALRDRDFDLDRGRLRVPGESPREVELAPSAVALLRDHQPLPAWRSGADGDAAVPLAALRARLLLVASNAGLDAPDEVDDRAVRHTYLAFLARQGLALEAVESIAGASLPALPAHYRLLSPPGRGKGLAEVRAQYPVPAPAS